MTTQLAIDGGAPVRTTPFHPWPVFDEAEERNLLEVLHSGHWGVLTGPITGSASEDFLVPLDYAGRVLLVDFDGLVVAFVSRQDLITAKRAAGRPQDLLDVEQLTRPAGKSTKHRKVK